MEIIVPIKGTQAKITVIEGNKEVGDFLAFCDESPVVAVDTETTGLELFKDDFRVRTIQVGTPREAWVLPVEELEDLVPIFKNSIGFFDKIVMHNSAFDLLALRQAFGIEVPHNKIVDTKILAHLVDSRSKMDGGYGHKLEELTAHYISEEIATDIKGMAAREAKKLKVKKADYFKTVDLWDEAYLTYAGMDVVLTSGLHRILEPKVPSVSRDLIPFEHELSRVCMEIEANGFLLDRNYSQRLADKWTELEAQNEEIALEFGVEKVNSGDQVAAALLELGVKIPGRTETGKYQVNAELLEQCMESKDPKIAQLGEAVYEAKKYGKWRKTWVQKFLDAADSEGKCHANINPLQARTARMSITGIPAQTLPSKDWKVRRCFIAEPGEVVISADYQAQELRVLAALSGDENMIQAFAEGADLHQITADASGVARSVGKTVNFAYVYGSGPKNIAESCGITVDKAKEVIAGFERAYPGVKKYNQYLQNLAKRQGYIITGSGRVLKVDKDRPYAALNYMIQSTSRDMTARALLRIDKAGLTRFIRLPIHDEIVACVPEKFVDSALVRFADLMRDELPPVVVDTDAELYGKSWAGGYLDKDKPEELAIFQQIEKELADV